MTIRSSYFIILFALYSCNNTDKSKEVPQDKIDSVVIISDSIVTPKKDSTPAPPDKPVQDGPGSIPIDEDHMNKASVSKEDSTIWLGAHMRLDHRIFGYEKPDTASRKMILLSIFTNDVENNPFKCPYGSYYGTSNMINMNLKYILNAGRFIRVAVIKDDKTEGYVYMEKKWIEFEK